VLRDGFVHFEPGEDEMQFFDDVTFPIAIGREASVAPRFSTAIVTSAGGAEQRNADWADARLEFDAGPGVRSDDEVQALIAFFRARRGAARGFRFRDPYDHSSAAGGAEPGPADQLIGVGDGSTTGFRLVKRYGTAGEEQERRITRPVPASVRVAVGGIETARWSLAEGGLVQLEVAPPAGVAVTAGFLFDVPVRFGEDRLEISRSTFGAAEVARVPIVEIREG
jgi:uncharacterized protein (TIGR02217 family)